MAKVQHFQQENAAAPVEPVVAPPVLPVLPPPDYIADDQVMTVYGMTLGDILRDARRGIEEMGASKDVEIAAKDAEITRLTAELAEAVKVKPREFTDAEIAKAVAPGAGLFGLKRLPDGSISVRVTVPEEVAIPLLSQAEAAGENPEIFVQRQLEEALLAYTCS